MKQLIISIAAAKGGVAKTTTSHALASYLGKLHKVLMFDCDPQRTLSSALLNLGTVKYTAFDVICNKVDAKLATVKALPIYKNVNVVAGSNLLTGVETFTSSSIDRQFIFEEIVASLASYSFLIFDCPSSQGLLTTGPAVCSDLVITPVATAPAAFDALQVFSETIKLIQKRLNPRLRWFILPTMFDQRQILDREVLDEINARYGDFVLNPPIRRRVSLTENMAQCRPCLNDDYEQFTKQSIKKDHP